MSIDLKAIFENCVNDVKGDKIRGTQRFLIAAKKADPDVTVSECMSIAGFTDEDEKKSLNLAQGFRTNIFNPLRNHLAKIKFQIDDPATIFGRSDKHIDKDERTKIRDGVLALLPLRTRTTTASTGKGNMDYLNDLIGVNENDNIDNDEE